MPKILLTEGDFDPEKWAEMEAQNILYRMQISPEELRALGADLLATLRAASPPQRKVRHTARLATLSKQPGRKKLTRRNRKALGTCKSVLVVRGD